MADSVLAGFVQVAEDSDFPVENLPFGVVAPVPVGRPRVAVAIGDHVVDLAELRWRGGLASVPLPTFDRPVLNPFLGLGPAAWSAVRRELQDRLSSPGDELLAAALRPMASVRTRLPIEVADYVDFYSSIHHATNLGRLLRPGGEPLLPSWRQLPVGYHGRAGTVVVSGTPIIRPSGLVATAGARGRYQPTAALDIELEVGFVVGVGTTAGERVQPDHADRHVFGAVLLNDWSARDIQAFEYQPLGPFLGKSFATTISPWVVSLEALQGALVAPPAQQPAPEPYLRAERAWGLELQLEVELNGAVVSRTGFADLYWTFAQQLAHITANGARLRTGDLYGSGTVSGPSPGTYGSLIELTWGGRDPLQLPGDQRRTYLEDGDTVVLRGSSGGRGTGRARIGFGGCAGTVVATASPSPQEG